VPVFNQERYVRQAISSCLAQTFGDIEVIVVDDGSTDDTLAEIRTIDDPRLTVIHQENGGPSAAVNRAFSASRGDYLALFAGDDINEPDRVEVQLGLAEASGPDPRVVFSDATFVDARGNVLERDVPDVGHGDLDSGTLIRHFLTTGNCMLAPSAFIPRNILARAGAFHPALFQLQDLDIWLRLLREARFHVSPRKLIRYRRHGESLSAPGRASILATRNEESIIFKRFLDALSRDDLDRWYFEGYAEELDDRAGSWKVQKALFAKTFRTPALDLHANALLAEEIDRAAAAGLDFPPHHLWRLLQTEDSLRPRESARTGETREEAGYRTHLEAGLEGLLRWQRSGGRKGPVRRALSQALAARRRISGASRDLLRKMRMAPGRLRHYGLGASLLILLVRMTPERLAGLRRSLARWAASLHGFHPLVNRLAAFRDGGRLDDPALLKRSFLLEGHLTWNSPSVVRALVAWLEEEGRWLELAWLTLGPPSPGIDEARRDDSPVRWIGCSVTPIMQRPDQALDIVDLGHPGQGRPGTYREFVPAGTYRFREPEVWGDDRERPEREVAVPASGLHSIDDAEVGSGFHIEAGRPRSWIVHEPAAHPRFGNVAGLREVLRSSSKEGTVVVRDLAEGVGHVDEAFLLGGRCSSNYYHFLVEYLPRLLEFDRSGLEVGIPILVSDNMPYQHFEALQALVRPGQRILLVGRNHRLKVKRLHVPTTSTYLPDDFGKPYWAYSALSLDHIAFLRQGLLGWAQGQEIPHRLGERIFLSRLRNPGRALSNEQSIARALKRQGFAVVYPEYLSLAEQIMLFRTSRIIVGPTGAAFTNMVFGGPGLRALGLISARNADFCSFSNLARAAEARFAHLAGTPVHPRDWYPDEESYAHASFGIDERSLDRALQEFCRD
jgi:hypothetical protein